MTNPTLSPPTPVGRDAAPRGMQVPMKAGSCSFHNGLLAHGEPSPHNYHMRSVLRAWATSELDCGAVLAICQRPSAVWTDPRGLRTLVHPAAGGASIGESVLSNPQVSHTRWHGLPGAGANMTPGRRRAMTCGYMPAGSTFNGTQNVRQQINAQLCRRRWVRLRNWNCGTSTQVAPLGGSS
jgi:hypothetical protein